ncbi:DUF4183 domain-containing protein [Paenibacillus taichungensis]
MKYLNKRRAAPKRLRSRRSTPRCRKKSSGELRTCSRIRKTYRSKRRSLNRRLKQQKLICNKKIIVLPRGMGVNPACREPRPRLAPVRQHETQTVGPHGMQGLVGEQGAQGPVGPHGVPGQLGAQGPAGTHGEQGLPGVPGPAGLRGEPGEPGLAGAQGPVGPQGERGEAGLPGAQGPVGPQGGQGEPGLTGAQGPAGPQGEQGSPGIPGAQGPTGPPGEQGPPGSIPGIEIIPTVNRYFYFPDTDLNLSDSVTIPVGEFVNDEGGSVSEFAGIGLTSYYNLYINGIVQPGNSYDVSKVMLFFPSQGGVLFAETPIILETIQLTANIING